MYLKITQLILTLLIINTVPVYAMLSPYAGRLSTQARRQISQPSYQQLPARQPWLRSYTQKPISPFKPYRYQPHQYIPETSRWAKLRSYLRAHKQFLPL